MLCKQVPKELEVRRIEKLHEKVKFYPRPEAASKYESKPEKAVVRLQLPKDKDGEEIEQDNKAVAVNSIVNALPYRIVMLNQQAARVVREELIAAMAKSAPMGFKLDE